jgi:hypothetical protein
MKPLEYTVSISVMVRHPEATVAAARALLEDQGIEPESGEPDVGEALRILLDPGSNIAGGEVVDSSVEAVRLTDVP